MGLTTTNMLVRRIIMVIISKSAEVSSEENEYHSTIIDKKLTFDSQVDAVCQNVNVILKLFSRLNKNRQRSLVKVCSTTL